MKTLVQCDFDGTITEKDIGFLLLDEFGRKEWRDLLQDYKEHRISVDNFNASAFSMIMANEATLVQATKNQATVREGFAGMVNYCSANDYRLVIISNGLEFYIKTVLKEIGMDDIEIYAAHTEFHSDGLKVQYIGLDGKRSDDGLKESYIKHYIKEGYRVIYIGNGDSDIHAAEHAYQVIARDDLLAYCRENNVNCEPFDDFNDVIRVLKQL